MLTHALQASLPEVLQLTAAAEASSDHPVAAALLSFAEAAIGLPDEVVIGGSRGDRNNSGNGGQAAGSSPKGRDQPSCRNVSWVAPASDLETLPGRCDFGPCHAVALLWHAVPCVVQIPAFQSSTIAHQGKLAAESTPPVAGGSAAQCTCRRLRPATGLTGFHKAAAAAGGGCGCSSAAAASWTSRGWKSAGRRCSGRGVPRGAATPAPLSPATAGW